MTDIIHDTPTWADDPSDSIAWRNYSAGWDAGYAAHRRGGHDDLTGHGHAYSDGYSDGWAQRALTA